MHIHAIQKQNRLMVSYKMKQRLDSLVQHIIVFLHEGLQSLEDIWGSLTFAMPEQIWSQRAQTRHSFQHRTFRRMCWCRKRRRRIFVWMKQRRKRIRNSRTRKRRRRSLRNDFGYRVCLQVHKFLLCNTFMLSMTMRHESDAYTMKRTNIAATNCCHNDLARPTQTRLLHAAVP